MSCKQVKLADIAEIFSGYAFKSSNMSTDEGIPLIKIKNIADHEVTRNCDSFLISSKIAENMNRYILQKVDFLVAMTGQGSVGRVGKMRVVNQKYYVNQRVAIVRVNENKANSDFVYYQIATVKNEEILFNKANGAGQPNISAAQIGELAIILPELEIQNKIASILNNFSVLIENNQKQIKLLEEAAQRLYKEWFVDLRFPGYENVPVVNGVPEGWKSCLLDDVIYFDPKVNLNKDRIKEFVPMSALSTSSMILNSREFTTAISNSGSKFQNDDTLFARITPCLENGKTAFVYGLKSAEGAVGSTEYIVMRSKRVNPYIVYLFSRTNNFRQAAINSMSGSDGRQRVKADKLKALRYLLADDNTIRQFAEIVQPFFVRIFTLNKQNEGLKELRDRLLPKLMSGELEV